MDNSITINTCPVRNYKDTLFRMIFGGKDEKSAKWRMELYNALSGKNHTNPAELELTTIENVIYITTKNDVSFLVDSQMTLYEQQSKVNRNMPLRGLMYFAQLYQMHLTKQEKDLFGGLVKIPVPQYVVFYNGDTNKPERYKMKLSEAFNFSDDDKVKRAEKAIDYEWTADVININKNVIELDNNALHKTCNALYDYIKYVDRIKVNQKNKMDIKAAVDEAVAWAIKEDLLEGFFAEQKAGVTAVSLTEFDQELYDKNRRREGYDEGVRENTIATAKALYQNGASKELITKSLNITLEELEEILKSSSESTENESSN